MKPILEIQNISKRFEIGHEQLPYYSFRERLSALFKPSSQSEEFWALNNISFDVMPGDSIGIIGRNGAGKSTLLKILSRIILPTSGKIISRGRIASLLEVGTGFHQELTGRENIFMNGSILGMKHAEIKSKFDEIIDFSGVEKFLDTPLKHYSSGMQLRLAFAVAAHLEPEILIIDEVLAVGDSEFQKKCIKKMEDVTGQGRTILFVSHNMDAVQSLCNRGIILNGGYLESNTSISDAIAKYYEKLNTNTLTFDNEIVKFINIKQTGKSLLLEVHFEISRRIDYPNLGFSINDQFGHPITGTNPVKSQIVDFVEFKPANKTKIKVEIFSPQLANGTYQLFVWLGDLKGNFFETKNPLSFSVNQMAKDVNRNPKLDGYVIPECKWEFLNID